MTDDDWIPHDGDHWGTARMIRARLGTDITPAMLRNWATRDGLPRLRMRDHNGRPQIRYPLRQTTDIEAAKFLSGRGAPRRLDVEAPAAA